MAFSSLEDAIAAGRSFLDTIDSYLADHWQNTTCSHLHQIFESFRTRMRSGRGGIAGIHGVSEYLLLRFISYRLGGDFDPVEPNNGELDPTRLHPLISGRGLSLTQGLPAWGQTNDGQKVRVQPDLAIWLGDYRVSSDLIAAAEIKNWPSKRSAISADIQRLEFLFNHWKGFRGVFVCLPAIKRHRSWIDELEGAKARHDWFDFIVLQDNSKLLFEEVDNKLGLGRIISRF